MRREISSSWPCAVLFDFDGTLADSYAAITASVNHVRAHHGLGPLPEDEVRRFVGRGPAFLLEHTVPGAELATDWPRYQAHHPSVMRAGTRLLPGAAEAVTALAHAGRSMGVCSNKPRLYTAALIEHLGLAPLIPVVVGPEDVPHSKPAPDMLLQALTRLEVAPADTLYVGDMVVDIETARAASVAVWVVPSGSDDVGALVGAQPDRLLRDLFELSGLIGACS